MGGEAKVRKKSKRMISVFPTSENQAYFECYSLFNSAASIHVFWTKTQFTNFWWAGQKANLFYGQNFVKILRWGNISLPLKVGNWISLLVLKNSTFVLNFLLNLVSLSCLEDQSLSWNHVSEKIHSSAFYIISYTIQNGNNYKIGNSELILSLGAALMSLAMISCRSYIHG